MPLQPGTQPSPYEITGAVGAGGMGEVRLHSIADARIDVVLSLEELERRVPVAAR